MTREPDALFFRVCGTASLLAAACLVVLAFLPRPPFAYSHEDIVWGAQQLTSEQLPEYLRYLKANLSFDGIYLLGHVMTWIGFGSLIAERRPTLGSAITWVGIASCGLDLLENSMRWVVVGHLQDGAAGPAVGFVWSSAVEMSFWAIYVATLLTSADLVGRGKPGLLVGSVGFLCVPAALVLYWRGFFASFVWLILWHTVSAGYLWSGAAQSERLQSATD